MNHLTATLLLFSFLAGALLTLWGLAHLEWPQDLPWSLDLFWWNGALGRYIKFLTICVVLVYFGCLWSRRSPLLIGGVIAVSLGLLAGALWPLLVTLWFAVASVLLGRSILAILRIPAEKDNWLVNLLVGAGAYGTVVGLLAHFPVNYPGVYGVGLALPLFLGWRVVIEQSNNLLAYAAQKEISGVNWVDVAIAVVSLFYFVIALLPEVGSDALAMHLFIPGHLALRHQWGFDASTYVWAVMPMLGDWIFSIGYMLAGETGARLINVGFILILGWLVREVVLWAGGTFVGARWAALIFLSTPLTFTEGSSLFIESVWAAFTVAGTLAVLRGCSSAETAKSDMRIAGLFLGYALATKAVTLSILPVLLLLLAWRYKFWHKFAGIRSLAVGLSLFFVIGIIPYGTAWWLTGNPIFPFFNHIFQSPYYPSGKDVFGVAVFGHGLTWDFLYRATFQSSQYLEAKAGASGFQGLLLFLPALIVLVAGRHWRGIALLFFGVATVIFVFQSMSYLRYVFPAWVILAAAIGVALEKILLRQVIVKSLGYVAAIATVGLNLIFLNAGGFYGDFPLKALIDESNRRLYLEKRLPIHSAVEAVNRLNTGNAPVAVFAAPLSAGLWVDALYPNWYNVAFQREIGSIKTDQDVADILLGRGINFLILDTNWMGVNCCSEGAEKHALIEKVTEKIGEFGSLNVRKVKETYRYKTELLINPNFDSISGWSLVGDAKYDSSTGIILASVTSPAYQGVAVTPGKHYKNVVVSRCAKEKEAAIGRIQVNWSDVKGQFVGVDIRTFECTPTWVEHTMDVTAPPNAVSAVVYVAGHFSIPVEFKGNSLRQ